MMLYRNKLYFFILIACLAGYIWIFINVKNDNQIESFDACLIKHFTDIPCPSCGTTRSVVSLSNGNFIQSLKINPIGYLVAIILIVFPVWILIDLITKKNSLLTLYKKTEYLLVKPIYAIPFALLIVINWIWNICKGL